MKSPVFEGLNEEQILAVTTTEGPLLVVAGPGTGKTLTLVRRIAYLVGQGADPDGILAVTFTNRAAREMRERTDLFLGEMARGVFIGTFHLLGLRIMKEALQEDFSVCSREEQIEILAGLTGGRRKGERIADRVSRVKNLVEEGDEEVREISAAYERALRERALYDFDDLIRIPLELAERGAVPARYGTGFRYFMIDEYQDINPVQYRLMRSLIGDRNNICAVGDSDQAIYAFRGADVENFLRFERDFEGAQRVVLSHNYRSSKIILTASSEVVRHNVRRIDKTLEAVKDEGKGITVITAPDAKSEARIVAGEIEARMGGTSHYSLMKAAAGELSGEACSFRDFAVIYRTNAQGRLMEEAFLESGMPYQVVHPKGSDTMKKVADRLQDMADEGLQISGLPEFAGIVDSLSLELGVPEDDRAILFQTLSACGDLPSERIVSSFMSEIVLQSSGDSFDPRADAVTLMTLHAAKGLEFGTVFITGAEEGLIPLEAAKDGGDVEEERRLFYVGMTRAKDDLVLTWARTRPMYREKRLSGPSPFVAEIPDRFLQRRSIPEGQKSRKQKQMKLF